ncbi:MAG: hypothetical protein ACT4P6_21575 [Gemmatimonadaceae bacterium]
MRKFVPAFAIAALCSASEAVSAQMTAVNRGGSGGGAYTFDLSDGEPISWFLEFSQQLKLTPDQKTSLISIRRRLRSDNDRFVERLDSVAEAVGLTLGERVNRLTAAEREALVRFNKITQPTRDSIRANNDVARAEALTLLNNVQTARLDSLMGLLQRDRRGVIRRSGGGGGGGGGP